MSTKISTRLNKKLLGLIDGVPIVLPGILSLFFMLSMTALTYAESVVFQADFRPRPPEMTLTGNSFKGPLKDILEEAVESLGHTIHWQKVPFPRSLIRLRRGNTDFVPRTIKTVEREQYIVYLGPIGFQQKDIVFIVRKGEENLFTNYEGLYSVNIGIKRGTAYFERFDGDLKLNKVASHDDQNLARMFVANRFQTMAVLDKQSIEREFKKIGFTDYSYANYKFVQKIGNYYGMSKKSKHRGYYRQLNATLQAMAISGRVTEIYKSYGLQPPHQ